MKSILRKLVSIYIYTWYRINKVRVIFFRSRVMYHTHVGVYVTSREACRPVLPLVDKHQGQEDFYQDAICRAVMASLLSFFLRGYLRRRSHFA